MTQFFYDTRFQDHKTGNHPESPARVEAVRRRFSENGLLKQLEIAPFSAANIERIKAVHDPAHVENVSRIASEGGAWLDADTCICPQSWEVARLAAGAVCCACQNVINGDSQNAFCLVRPPGHHAESHRGMGFCLFNNVAVAAQLLIETHRLGRVLIVDWDVHHGNGTQQIFYDRADVAYFSIHRYPFYPGTGASSETGIGEGAGATMNLPVEFGTPAPDYINQFRIGLSEFARKHRPEFIILSAGFDAHRLDPIGSLGLDSIDFATMTDILIELAKEHCDGRLVSVLEGGYNLDALAESAQLHVERLLSVGT